MQYESSGLCACGCGQPTKLATQTSRRFGWVRGQPLKYIVGHVRRTFPSLAERFWAKVEKSDTCWLWVGSRHSSGYGRIEVGGKYPNAQRVSWELHFGPIPEGLFVCHRCDNPACVRPDHLFLGTPAENSRDMTSKRRTFRGEARATSKLTPDQVLALREAHAAWPGRPYGRTAALARQFGVNESTVRKVIQGRLWAHVTG